MPPKTILIFYTELAGYTLACLDALIKNQVTVHVVHYPVNKEAPFNFNKANNNNIFYYNKATYNKNQLLELTNSLKPDLIYCAGWSDKIYLSVIKKVSRKYVTLLGFDNKWFGNFKQQLSTVYAKLFITPYFNYAFVPGKVQEKFAKKIGFKSNKIITKAYSADVELFNAIYQKQLNHKTTHLPHRFIYIGRYYDFKGINELWQAFIELQKETPNDWELWCLGTGDVKPIEHEKIKHFGFIQPNELEHYLFQTSVFILPSRFEPWGVVVHEMAAAGFPLLLSNEIGAKESFLENNKNGFEFEANNFNSIKQTLKNIINKSDDELVAMGQHSHNLAQCITPQIWAERLLILI